MINKKVVGFAAVSLMLVLAGLILFISKRSYPLILPKEVNLKNVQLSDKTTFSIKIKNATNSTVDIPRIYTSCGCTTVLDPKVSFTLAPYSSAEVSLQFDPSSMHKNGDDVLHEIYVLTSSPLQKEFIVQLKGKIL